MLEKFNIKVGRKVRGTDVKAGQAVWAVKKGDLYFIWCYTNEETAKLLDRKLAGPTFPGDRGANWRERLDQLVPTDLAPEKV